MAASKPLTVKAEVVLYGDEIQGCLTKLTNNQPKGLGFYIGDQTMIDQVNEAKEGFFEDMQERRFTFATDTVCLWSFIMERQPASTRRRANNRGQLGICG